MAQDEGDWLEPNEYDRNDTCSLCYEKFGIEKAVYRTPCGHLFHNNCVDEYCDKNSNNEYRCPLCRALWGTKAHGCVVCVEVDDFKNNMYGDEGFGPHVLAIYNAQLQNGGNKKNKRTRKTRKTETKREETKKNKKTRKTRKTGTKRRNKKLKKTYIR